MTQRRLRLGVAGLGRAFTLMRPAFSGSGLIDLVAAADPRPEARRQFAAEFGGIVYDDVQSLVRNPAVEGVYIASPHQFHAEHALAAAAAGKHILVEKPMALTLAEAERMVEAARKAGVKLIVGHSHGFDAPIALARRIIASGEFGRVKMITALNYTDFLYRPRRPEELDTAAGGGVVFNQAAHQVDIVRLLAGGVAESVTAQTGIWDASRPTEGAYTAMLRFAGDVAATIVYSGYAHFDSDALVGWLSEMGAPKDRDAFAKTRRLLPPGLTPPEELALREQRGYGAAPAGAAPDAAPRWHEHFGFIVVSCERADLRPVPQGVVVDSDSEHGLRPLPRPQSPRREVVEELCDAVLGRIEPLHSGAWGLATLEASLAILQSSRERRTIALARQVPVATG